LSGAIFSGNVQSDYLLANANLKVSGIIESVQTQNSINYPNLGGRFVANVDSNYQIVVQNLSDSINATSELKLVGDTGDNQNHYMSIGIHSSNYDNPWQGTIFNDKPFDGFIECVGGNVIIKTLSNVFLGAGNALVYLLNSNIFSLGTSNLQFQDGTVQSSAITDVPGLYANIGNLQISLDTLDSNVGNISTTVDTIVIDFNLLDANVGNISTIVDTTVIDLNLLSANVGAFETYIDANVGSLSNIGSQPYTPNNAANYNATITNIQDALDELAARLKALGG
jgi:hypothetical protein